MAQHEHIVSGVTAIKFVIETRYQFGEKKESIVHVQTKHSNQTTKLQTDE